MDRETFSFLSQKTRANILFKKGQFLEAISYNGYRISLHSLNSFFVVVYFKNNDDIMDIQIAEQNELDRFLSKIQLEKF